MESLYYLCSCKGSGLMPGFPPWLLGSCLDKETATMAPETVCVNVCVCMCVCVCVCVYVCVCVCVSPHAIHESKSTNESHTCKQQDTRTHTHTHIQRHTHRSSSESPIGTKPSCWFASISSERSVNHGNLNLI